MEENREITSKLEDVIYNYNSLKNKNPNNELLRYIKIEGIGFCILEGFRERFGCNFEESLINYCSALEVALIEVK